MVATNEELEIGINVAWVSSCTYLVFLMQLGFAFLEAGSVRLKNL
jgi:Amt family ammonium transporter